MNDFRQGAYRRYVTTFKGVNGGTNDESLKAYFRYFRRNYLPHLSEVGRDAAILELGCGPGYLLRFLKEHGYKNVRGIDVSEEQVGIGTKEGLNSEQADVVAYLRSLEHSFDVIIAIDVLEHFTKDELLEIVPMVRKALRPGGLFIVQTPNGQGLFPNQVIFGDLTHLTTFNPGSLEQLMRLCSLQDVKIYEPVNNSSGLKAHVRTLAWKIIKTGANIVRKIETGKTQDIWTENFICCCRAASDTHNETQHSTRESSMSQEV